MPGADVEPGKPGPGMPGGGPPKAPPFPRMDSLDVLDGLGLDHCGAFRTQEERDENNGIVVEEINGISIAFLDYTYGTNYNVDTTGFSVNCFNLNTGEENVIDLDEEGEGIKYTTVQTNDCGTGACAQPTEFQDEDFDDE